MNSLLLANFVLLGAG